MKLHFEEEYRALLKQSEEEEIVHNIQEQGMQLSESSAAVLCLRGSIFLQYAPAVGRYHKNPGA